MAVAEPLAAPLLPLIGWLTVVGFSHPPYADLRLTGPRAANAAMTLGACALAGASLGVLARLVADSCSMRRAQAPTPGACRG